MLADDESTSPGLDMAKKYEEVCAGLITLQSVVVHQHWDVDSLIASGQSFDRSPR